MDKICIAVISVCLVIGGATHIFDNLYFGFLPYKFAPDWINFYWTSLGVIDLLAVYLLVKLRKFGIVLTLLIMVSDVVINSMAYYSLQIIRDPMSLQLQTLFLGFCIGSCIWLWKDKSANRL